MAAKLIKGSMLDHMAECDHLLICTYTNLVSSTGELSMMYGLAHEVAKKFPKAPKALGTLIKELVGDCGFYYLSCNNKIGVFQVGILHRNGPSLGIISESVKRLAALVEANPSKLYYLEAFWPDMPSFTCDGFMRMLPENVHVWVPE